MALHYNTGTALSSEAGSISISANLKAGRQALAGAAKATNMVGASGDFGHMSTVSNQINLENQTLNPLDSEIA